MLFCVPKCVSFKLWSRTFPTSGKADTKPSPNLSTMATTMDSPAGSHFSTTACRESQSNSSSLVSPAVYNSAMVSSFDDGSEQPLSPNMTFQLQCEVRQLQAEKRSVENENFALRNHGVELVNLLESDQSQTIQLQEELTCVKMELEMVLSRNTSPLEHRNYIGTNVKARELQARQLSISNESEELYSTKLQSDLRKCRTQRDQAQYMLKVEKSCRLRDNRGSNCDSLFSLEVRAAALLHQAKILKKVRGDTRAKLEERLWENREMYEYEEMKAL